jgi:hypothetical protein
MFQTCRSYPSVYVLKGSDVLPACDSRQEMVYYTYSIKEDGEIGSRIFKVMYVCFAGHNASHMSVIPIEKVFAKNKDSLKLRESEWIKEFGTLVPRGMNIKS